MGVGDTKVCNDLAQTYFELGQDTRAMELLEESNSYLGRLGLRVLRPQKFWQVGEGIF